ncbi:MAG TPA: hypothetical protein V6C91_14665 [Coleofasciculaceae cyanobacterium]
MTLFLSITLHFVKVFAITSGVGLLLALSLAIVLVGELNKILSVAEECEFSEPIDLDSGKNASLPSTVRSDSAAVHSDSLLQPVSSLH